MNSALLIATVISTHFHAASKNIISFPAPTPEPIQIVHGKLTTTEGGSFLFRRSHNPNSLPRKFISEFSKEASTEVLVHDEVIFENGLMTTYIMDQRQIQEKGKATLLQGKLYFEKTNPFESVKTTETISLPLLGMTCIGEEVSQNWSELVDKRKSRQYRIPVISRSETFGFEIEFDAYEQTTAGEVVRFKVAPSAFFISLLAKPLFVRVTVNEPHKLVSVEGRMPVKAFRTLEDYNDLEGVLQMN